MRNGTKTRHLLTAAIAVVAAPLFFGTVADAAPIALNNPGFDAFQGTIDQSTPLFDDRFTFEVTSSPAASAAQNFSASTGASTGEGANVLESMEGNYRMFRRDASFTAPTGSMGAFFAGDRQATLVVPGVSALANSTYTATVQVSNRVNAGVNVHPTFAMDLLAGATVLTPTSVTYTAPTSGQTSLYTLVVDTGATPPAGDLALRISVAGSAGGISTQTFVDNLTLDVVPEPASLALLGMGGLMLATRRRRA